MPAAAVIPAPIAYMNVVAVKTLVVDIVGSDVHFWSRIHNQPYLLVGKSALLRSWWILMISIEVIDHYLE